MKYNVTGQGYLNILQNIIKPAIIGINKDDATYSEKNFLQDKALLNYSSSVRQFMEQYFLNNRFERKKTFRVVSYITKSNTF